MSNKDKLLPCQFWDIFEDDSGNTPFENAIGYIAYLSNIEDLSKLKESRRKPLEAIFSILERDWNARSQPQNVEGDEQLQEAFKIADARNDEVKELDFGNVFWACGVLADYIRNNPKPEPSGYVKAALKRMEQHRDDFTVQEYDTIRAALTAQTYKGGE